jgi:hypothetical protein
MRQHPDVPAFWFNHFWFNHLRPRIPEEGSIVAARKTVMPRAGGASSTLRPIDSITSVSGILDRPPSRTMTPNMRSRSRGAERARGLTEALAQTRAQGRPGARCTRGLVCNGTRKCAHEHTGPAESIRPSLRNGLTAYGALSLETNSSCLHRRRIDGFCEPGWA